MTEASAKTNRTHVLSIASKLQHKGRDKDRKSVISNIGTGRLRVLGVSTLKPYTYTHTHPYTGMHSRAHTLGILKYKQNPLPLSVFLTAEGPTLEAGVYSWRAESGILLGQSWCLYQHQCPPVHMKHSETSESPNKAAHCSSG